MPYNMDGQDKQDRAEIVSSPVHPVYPCSCSSSLQAKRILDEAIIHGQPCQCTGLAAAPTLMVNLVGVGAKVSTLTRLPTNRGIWSSSPYDASAID